MTLLTILYVISVVTIGTVLFWFTWAMDSWRRLAAVVLMIIVSSLGLGAFAELLSRPKSVELEFALRGTEEAEVLSSVIVEGKAIYIWLQLPDLDQPRYYLIPWSEASARALRKAIDDAKGERRIRIRFPFQWSWETREAPFFYPMPWPKLPDKMGQPLPEVYQHPEFGA